MNKPDIRKIISDYKAKALPAVDLFFQTEIGHIKNLSTLPVGILTRIHKLTLNGKFIRGFLITLGYEISGNRITDGIIDASTFIEIAQTGILIHDDIMDEDDQRRGLATIHADYASEADKLKAPFPRHYGESMAICAGDIAFYLSWEKLLSAQLARERILDAAHIYARFFTRVAYGQMMDLSLPVQKPEETEILNMYFLKTAEYSGAMPLRIGAALGGQTDKSTLENLTAFGLDFGWIYQIKDDLLGLFGDPSVTGKSNTSDLHEGKYTLLVSRFLAHATQTELKRFYEVFGNKNPETGAVLRVRNDMLHSDAPAYCEKIMQKYYSDASDLISRITDHKEIQATLLSLLQFALNRNK